MKIITAVLLIVLVFFKNSDGETEMNDLQKKRLHGKVKSVKSTSYEIEEEEGKISRGVASGSNFLVFNQMGFMIEETSYTMEGSLNYRRIFEFDKKGHMTSKDFYDSKGARVLW